MWPFRKKERSQAGKDSGNPALSAIFSLAPNIPEHREGYKIYQSYLDVALKDDSICNIAITGSYGIGKSSFLKWYAEQKKYLRISLCDFTRGNEKKSINELGCDICRQLLIGCSQVQKRRKKRHLVFACIFMLLFCVLAGYYMLLNNVWGSFDAFNGILGKIPLFHSVSFREIAKVKWLPDLIVGIAFILGIPALFGWLICTLSVSKFSFKAKEIEAEVEVERSKNIHFMDLLKVKLIDELRKAAPLYDHIVIFEDFDRTDYDNCVSLFTDLREINRLINYSIAGSRGKTPVRFIYVLRDDLFSGSENAEGRGAKSPQVKFFDFIIPFIPGIYQSASAEYIDECLKTAGVCERVRREFIFTVDGTLDDYRIIRNIANEYQIIKKVYLSISAGEERGSDGESMEKSILALAAYKTLMPEDYAKIRSGRSSLFGEYQVLAISTVPTVSTEDSIKEPCVRSLWKNQWLSMACLEFVGLSAYELNKYICEMIGGESYEPSPQHRSWIQKMYPLWRRALAEDTDSLERALKSYAYTILRLECHEGYAGSQIIQKAINGNVSRTKEKFDSEYFAFQLSRVHTRKEFYQVVQYLIKFGCCDWAWLFTKDLPMKDFLICISLSAEEKKTLFAMAKEPLAAYLNDLDGAKLTELLDSTDPQDRGLIQNLPINPGIREAIKKRGAFPEVSDG